MKTSYFLGANSCEGFKSLYDNFCAGKGDYLHVIKGGPGTGKSGFMRKIGARAEERGLDVEYVICSGDLDSLDGVYIPALHLGWVDGTAPHVIDPERFGVSGDYLDIVSFCRTPLELADRQRVEDISAEYKGLYADAYRLLFASYACADAFSKKLIPDDALNTVRRRIRSILDAHPDTDGQGILLRRYLSAVSYAGRVRLADSLSGGCLNVYYIDDKLSCASDMLTFALDEALSRGMDVIACHSPFKTNKLEALLLPGAELAFTAGDWEIQGQKHIRLDALADGAMLKKYRKERNDSRRLAQELESAAYEKLQKAKSLHDELEQVYRPYMDFSALDVFTECELKRLFP